MPHLMSLEGLSRTDAIRAQLNAPQQSWWTRSVFRRPQQMQGLGSFADPLISHPVVFALGIFAGFWLAGTAAGKKLLKQK